MWGIDTVILIVTAPSVVAFNWVSAMNMAKVIRGESDQLSTAVISAWVSIGLTALWLYVLWL